MKRLIIILFMLAGIAYEAGAVLKEKDLEQTLTILQAELEEYNNELTIRSAARRDRMKRLITQLLQTMKRADQNALMLYSQQQENVFDLTYACHEATKQYKEFHRQQLPFTDFLERTEKDIARYDSLIKRLENMPNVTMTQYGDQKRDTCLVLAKNIRTMLEGNARQLRQNIRFYETTELRLKEQNDYAQKRYSDIQKSIFINGGDNYLTLLGHLDRRWQQLQDSVRKKYDLDPDSPSRWSAVWILGTFLAIFVYVLIAIVLNQVFFRFLMPKRFRTEEFEKKRSCIIMTTTTITFAIIQGAILLIGTGQNFPFLYMAASLLVEFAWLLGVILTSLLLRVKGEQLGSAVRIYAPLIAVGFIVIGCRIILIPNELVNLVLPPILLICALWQWFVIRRHNQNIPHSDIFYTYISLTVFIASVVCSFIGYTLLAVQLLIWWIMQLTCILTITCISRYLEIYAKKKRLAEKPITQTWAYLLVEKMLLPVLSVTSIMLSIYWAANVFNLGDMCWHLFKYNFIDMQNAQGESTLQVSFLKLTMVISMWYVFRYIVVTVLALMKVHLEIKDPSTAASKEMMGKNVIQVFVWGVWLMLSLSIMHISVAWLLAISGGLSTGIGFASKDIIENIYYGASLMAGRIKVGDWIQVEGTMGKVMSINYTSTVIESLYGEVITYQNSQLFSKNYKNLTRNHGYVLAVVPFGVAYGSNLKDVTNLVEEALNNMHHQWIDQTKRVRCVCSEMADSSVNFNLFVWADAPKKSYVVSDVLKCVYDTLSQNGIQIPFPQRDIHIIQG
jgi:small-conductance mechanosensitive channel